MTDNDSTLLGRYVTEGSESAFAELVRRKVDLVHSAALRQVGGDLHRAQDVIIVRERQPVIDPESGTARRAYGFADGHTEIHFARDQNFESWERERMVAATN